MGRIDIKAAGSMLDDDSWLETPRQWHLDGDTAHYSSSCAGQQSTSITASMREVRLCPSCWVRALKDEREHYRDLTQAQELVHIEARLEEAEMALKAGTLEAIAPHSLWLANAARTINKAGTPGTSAARAQLTQRAQAAHSRANTTLVNSNDEATTWAKTEGAYTIPWGDLSSDEDHTLYGTYQGDSGIRHIAQVWVEAGRSGSDFDPERGRHAADAELKHLQRRPSTSRGKSNTPENASDWHHKVVARTEQLSGDWTTVIESVKTATGDVTVGVYDPDSLRDLYEPLELILGRCSSTCNADFGTIILRTSAAVAELLKPYHSSTQTRLRIDIVDGHISGTVAETAAALWDPADTNGAYPTLADAIEGAVALEAA